MNISDEVLDAAVDALVASRLGDHAGINGEEFVEAARAALEAAAPYMVAPQPVTSLDHLKDLEDPRTILTDYRDNAYQWGIGLDGSEGWQSTRDPNPITSNHLWRFTPLAVLHVGGAA